MVIANRNHKIVVTQSACGVCVCVWGWVGVGGWWWWWWVGGGWGGGGGGGGGGLVVVVGGIILQALKRFQVIPLQNSLLEWVAFRFMSLTQWGRLTHIIVTKSLVQIMDYCLFGPMPLYEPMLHYCQLDPQEHTSVKLYSKFKYLCLGNVGYLVAASTC